jgi:hypothetical protein
MRRPGLLISSIFASLFGVAVCFTGSSFAQPASPSSPQPPPAEAAPPASASDAPAPPESALPAPAPVTPAAPAAAPPAAPAAPAAAPPAAPATPPPQASSPPDSPALLGSPAVTQVRRQSDQTGDQRLSANKALALSLGGSLTSWALILAGKQLSNGAATLGFLSAFVTPNLGHWYQGKLATRGTALRLVSLVAVVYAVSRQFGCEGDDCRDPTGERIAIGALVLFVGATIDDIIDAPLRVRRHNKRLENIGLTPMITDRSVSLTLGGRF